MPNNSPQFSLDIIVTDETSNEINEVISNCVCRDSGGGRCDIDRHLCEGAARRLGKAKWMIIAEMQNNNAASQAISDRYMAEARQWAIPGYVANVNLFGRQLTNEDK